MNKEILRILTRLTLTVIETLQLSRQLDDTQIQVTQCYPVHVSQAGLIDIIQDIQLLGNMLHIGMLKLTQIRRLRVKPAYMIIHIGTTHVKSVTGT